MSWIQKLIVTAELWQWSLEWLLPVWVYPRTFFTTTNCFATGTVRALACLQAGSFSDMILHMITHVFASHQKPTFDLTPSNLIWSVTSGPFYLKHFQMKWSFSIWSSVSNMGPINFTVEYSIFLHRSMAQQILSWTIAGKTLLSPQRNPCIMRKRGTNELRTKITAVVRKEIIWKTRSQQNKQ